MWTLINSHGITALRAIPLILLSGVLIALMFNPLEVVLSPKLPPLLPIKKPKDEKTPLRKEDQEKPSYPNQSEKPSSLYPIEFVFKITLKIEKEEK